MHLCTSTKGGANVMCCTSNATPHRAARVRKQQKNWRPTASPSLRTRWHEIRIGKRRIKRYFVPSNEHMGACAIDAQTMEHQARKTHTSYQINHACALRACS